jgi:hypothetical protein
MGDINTHVVHKDLDTNASVLAKAFGEICGRRQQKCA